MKRMHPDEMYDETIGMAQRLGARTVGIEVTSLNEFIIHPFKNHMLQKRQMFNIVELKPRGKKEQRIRSLIPWYRLGMIYHNNSGVCGPLEDQLLSFPRSAFDDAMDALAYVVEMMDLGERYFGRSEAGEEIPASEYAELERLDALEPAFAGWEDV